MIDGGPISGRQGLKMSCQICRFLSSTIQAVIVTACLLIAAIYSFIATFHVLKAMDHNATTCANFTFFIVRSPECNPSSRHDLNATTTISPQPGLKSIEDTANGTTRLLAADSNDNVIPLDPLILHVNEYAPNSLRESVHEWLFTGAICYIAILHFCGGLLIILRRSKGLTIIMFGYIGFVTAIVLATVISQIASKY